MRVLLIRLRLIGDVVLSTPLIRAVKRTFPGATLSYLVERDAAAVVAGNPHLNDVIVVERSRGLARIADDLRLAWRLRRARFDVVIDMHGGPRSSWLTLATGAPQRIGYDIAGRQWMYTRTVPRARELRPRHSVVNQWDLLSAIDGWTGAPPVPADDPVEMPLDAAADRRIAGRLQETGVDPRHELIVIHVSASNPFRRWPEPAFADVVSSLVRESPARRVILSSGPSDRAAADRIAATARDLLPARGPLARRRFRRVQSAGASGADRPQPAVHRRGYRSAARRRGDHDTDRRDLRPDLAGTLDPLAARDRAHRVGRGVGPALPSLRSAGLRAW